MSIANTVFAPSQLERASRPRGLRTSPNRAPPCDCVATNEPPPCSRLLERISFERSWLINWPFHCSQIKKLDTSLKKVFQTAKLSEAKDKDVKSAIELLETVADVSRNEPIAGWRGGLGVALCSSLVALVEFGRLGKRFKLDPSEEMLYNALESLLAMHEGLATPAACRALQTDDALGALVSDASTSKLMALLSDMVVYGKHDPEVLELAASLLAAHFHGQPSQRAAARATFFNGALTHTALIRWHAPSACYSLDFRSYI
jgi:hypothetical protein